MLRIHLCLLGCLASHGTSPPGVLATGGKDDRRGGEEEENCAKIPFYSGSGT